MPPRRPLLASDLYALSQSTINLGDDECHWCGAPCKRLDPHDDAPQLPGQPRTHFALRPGNGYVCRGCWFFRRQRITVPYFGTDKYKDGQAPKNHSWYITPQGAWAVPRKEERTPEDAVRLYKLLLKPPRRFVLMLTDAGTDNLLQFARANDLDGEVLADTPYTITVNNRPLPLTVYELEQALHTGVVGGKEPAVAALAARYGLPMAWRRDEIEEGKAAKRPGAGRPSTKGDTGPPMKRLIWASGAVT
jgi:hypothetical protein